MATTKANAHTDTKSTPALILFGMDETHSPRAAAFASDQVKLATKAAELMQLRAVPVVGPELAKLAAQLPPGRIYASGQGFVPPVKCAVYDRLQELTQPTAAAPNLPKNWDSIGAGALVLIQESPSEGWFEAIVVGKDNDMLSLKWRDYPKSPPVTRHQATVALLKPSV